MFLVFQGKFSLADQAPLELTVVQDSLELAYSLLCLPNAGRGTRRELARSVHVTGSASQGQRFIISLFFGIFMNALGCREQAKIIF